MRRLPYTPWHWALSLCLISLLGLVVLTGGCPGQPPANGDGNGQVDDGNGDNGGTDGGSDNGGTDGGSDNGGDDNGDDGGDGGSGDDGGSGGGSGDDGGSGGDDGGSGGDDGGSGGDDGGDDGGSSGGGSSGGGSGGGETPEPPTTVTLSVIAQTGDDVPDQPSGVTFEAFGNPIIDAKGRIAFWATYTGSGAKGEAGLYVWDGDELVRAIHDDPNVVGIVPSRSTDDYFGKTSGFDPREYPLAWGGGDRLLFVSDIAGEKPTKGIYRWRATDGNLARVAEREQIGKLFDDVAGDPDSPVIDVTFGLVGVSDDGLGVFGAQYTYISTSNSFVVGNAVCTSNGSTITLVADDTTQKTGVVPDRASDVYYSNLAFTTTLNAAGDLLFQSQYTNTAMTTSGRGAYLRRGSTSYRVIDSRTGKNWPGLPTGARLSPSTFELAIGPEGHIALETKLVIDSVTEEAVIVWDWDTGEWTEYTGPSGAPADELLTGVNDDGAVVLLSSDHPYLVDASGRTRLDSSLPTGLQTVIWATSGGSISNHGRAVLSYSTADGAGLLLWTGDELLVIADVSLDTPTGLTDLDTITGTESDRPGVSGMLNDNDEAVFRATMTNGDEVIYLATGE